MVLVNCISLNVLCILVGPSLEFFRYQGQMGLLILQGWEMLEWAVPKTKTMLADQQSVYIM